MIDEVVAAQMLLPPSRRRKTVTVKDVEGIVAKIARIPPKNVSRDRQGRAQDIGAGSGRRWSLVRIRRSRPWPGRSGWRAPGLREPEKPIGNYLFSGPTGVGKTEVARQLGHILGIEMIRFDMSEYMERHSVSRLIGAPPGYVGFDQGGMLTDAVDQHPHCVLLLDEIEKAHPDVFNILLQIMDYGRLTDHNGKTVDFRNVILIMTTNAGASELTKQSIGFGAGAKEDADSEAINRMFTPEFRNRLDATIAFGHLTLEIVSQIVDKFIIQLENQLADRRVTIELNQPAREWLARKGYDRLYGARPLARVIQDHIKKPLADELLFGRLVKGGVVRVTLADDELVFEFQEDSKNGSAEQISELVE